VNAILTTIGVLVKRYFFCVLLVCISTAAFAQEKNVTRPEITGIAGVGLAAQSLPADRKFYEQTLGWVAAPSVEAPGGLRFYGAPRQWVEVLPAKSADEHPFQYVAFATSDAKAMRLYLAQHGVAVPESISRWEDGSLGFLVKDPEENAIEFVQRGAESAHSVPAPRAISSQIIHAGFIVRNVSVEDSFYKKILGFRPYWKGGMKDGVTDFISIQVPNGTDWIEYILNVPANPSHRELGVVDHFSLGVVNIDTVVAKLSQRGWKPSPESDKLMGRDGKYQLNLYDPDDVRVEFMQLLPTEKPCCSPFTGPQPEPE
jgi:catechol 2,3-dioxygenase-like lactoylglutathione lyase family enzyme